MKSVDGEPKSSLVDSHVHLQLMLTRDLEVVKRLTGVDSESRGTLEGPRGAPGGPEWNDFRV